MASDIWLGLDAARDNDHTSLQLIEMESGKVVAKSDNIKCHLNPLFFRGEIKEHSEQESLKKFGVSWSAEITLTHKEAREMKKRLRAMLRKKPRLPRKKKKALKKRFKKMANDFADAFIEASKETIIDNIYKEIFH